MRFSSAGYEVNNVFNESNYIQIDSDTTRREETTDIKLEMRANNEKIDRHSLMSKVSIHDSKTLDAYKSVARTFFHYCREHDLGRNHYQYTAEDVKDFLQDRFESGKSYETLIKDCSALNKLDDILNASQITRFGEYKFEKQDFSKAIQEFKKEIKAEFKDNIHINRAYNNPENVIANLKSDEAKMCATLQYSYGLRVMNASYIRLNENGTLYVISKAGYTVKEFKISQSDYDKLKEFSNGKSNFRLIEYDKYRAELKEACARCGETYSGTHAFRYNFCQNLYSDLRNSGKSHDEARAICAKELFHGRLDIVDRYLGR